MYDYIDTDPSNILTNGNPAYGEVATTSNDHMNEGMRGAVDIRVAANEAYIRHFHTKTISYNIWLLKLSLHEDYRIIYTLYYIMPSTLCLL